MLGFDALGLHAMGMEGEDADTLTNPSTPGQTATIDATKVPASRRIVFPGSIRVVKFPGSIRKVVF
jgi:hypothetical protein